MTNTGYSITERLKAAFNTEYSREHSYKLYDCFIAVNDEEKRLYFIDIEYHKIRYNRIYQVVTERALMDFITRTEKELKIQPESNPAWDEIHVAL